MPTYEYACTSCGHRLEVYQSFSDKPLEKCEKCGGSLRRVFHPVGVLFKGSGFYSTDSKSKKTEPKATTGKKSDSSDSAPKSGSSESTGSAAPKEKSSDPKSA